MPKYTYTCDSCGTTFDGFGSIHSRNRKRKCVCGAKAKRDIASELSGSGNFNELNKDRERISRTMGVNPKQIKEAMEAYPGSEYDPKTGGLKIKNRAHKLYEMKRRKMEEFPSNYFDELHKNH